jgi:type IV pilus modification protein PilV
MMNQKGFSLIEVMIATIVLTIGLTGVALMQTSAIRSNSFAWTMNIGSNHSQEWMEWLINQVSRPTQDTTLYLGHMLKENFVALSSLDSTPGDDAATEIQLPATETAMLAMLQEKKFVNPDGIAFSAEQIPKAPANSYSMVWRVMAERPMPDTTTVEIETRINNAFTRNKREIIRFIVSANM